MSWLQINEFIKMFLNQINWKSNQRKCKFKKETYSVVTDIYIKYGKYRQSSVSSFLLL